MLRLVILLTYLLKYYVQRRGCSMLMSDAIVDEQIII